MRALALALPPLAEQREITRRATAALDTVDHLRSAVAAAATATDRAARVAVTRAFLGDVVVDALT